MKTQDLQQPYRALAEMRREQQINSEYVKRYEKQYNETRDLNYAFDWYVTKEKSVWWNKVNIGIAHEIPAESLAELKEWQKEHPEFEEVLISEEKTAEEIHDALHEILNGTENDLDEKYKKNPFSHPIFDTIEKFKNNDSERLFTAALAAMQGFIASYAGATKDPDTEPVATKSWNYAEALINEGKKRGHLQLKTRG